MDIFFFGIAQISITDAQGQIYAQIRVMPLCCSFAHNKKDIPWLEQSCLVSIIDDRPQS